MCIRDRIGTVLGWLGLRGIILRAGQHHQLEIPLAAAAAHQQPHPNWGTGCLPVSYTHLETHSRLAPRGARAVVTNRGAAFATAVRVIAGVHDGTTAAGANAHVALAASLAQVDVLVIDVGNLTDDCGAVHGHVAHLTRCV